MTDQELLQALRSGRNSWDDDDVAADRIEELAKERDCWMKDSAAAWDKCEDRRLEAEALEAKLAKAVEALELIAGVKGYYSCPFPEYHEGYGAFAVVKSREALAELEGK